MEVAETFSVGCHPPFSSTVHVPSQREVSFIADHMQSEKPIEVARDINWLNSFHQRVHLCAEQGRYRTREVFFSTVHRNHRLLRKSVASASGFQFFTRRNFPRSVAIRSE